MKGTIYILTNPVMPDLVKIGGTTQLEERVRCLSSNTGIPVPFEVYYACVVEDFQKVEQHIHDAFSDHRINPKREFFRINPERIISALKLAFIEEVTPANDYVEDNKDLSALNKERNRSSSRRSNFKFSEVSIEPGSVLSFVRDENITATVVDDRKVEFEGEVTSLSAAAKTVFQRDYGKNWLSFPGTDFWKYDNEILRERRERLEGEDEDEDSED